MASRLVLAAVTARELMSEAPVSLRADAPLREALVLLTDKGFGAAPVIDDAGRPIGVLSGTDILVHERERTQSQSATEEDTKVRDLMTPAVFSITPQTPAAKVVSEMLSLRVHRLFVVDKPGVVVGVISVLDILKHLRAE